MRVLAHRPLEALDPTAPTFQFLQQHHLMHIIASQPIGGRHKDALTGRRFDRIPEMIQAWTIQAGPTVAIIANNLLGLEFFAVGGQVSSQASYTRRR
jgi:hypothetical protein